MITKIIDTHQHLWDLSKLELPWVESVPQLNRSFVMSDYLLASAKTDECRCPYKIDKTIYMEVDVAESNIRKEIDLIVGQIREQSSPLTTMVAATRPGESMFDELLELAKSLNEICGFRRVLHTDQTPKGFCLQTDFTRDVSKLGDANLTFDICIRREELDDAAKLITACPNTQFVLDHCGNVDVRISAAEMQQWKTDIARLAQRENVVCKVSGFVWTIQNLSGAQQHAIAPILDHVLESFGEDRLLFGGDWPVCTLSALSFGDWMDSLFDFASKHHASFNDKLFYANAARIYL